MVTVKGLKKKGLFQKGEARVPYTDGITVGQVLERAGVILPMKTGAIVTINAKPAVLETPVADNALVVVTPAPENG